MKNIFRIFFLLRVMKNLISESHSLNAIKNIINKIYSIHVKKDIKTIARGNFKHYYKMTHCSPCKLN